MLCLFNTKRSCLAFSIPAKDRGASSRSKSSCACAKRHDQGAKPKRPRVVSFDLIVAECCYSFRRSKLDPSVQYPVRSTVTTLGLQFSNILLFFNPCPPYVVVPANNPSHVIEVSSIP